MKKEIRDIRIVFTIFSFIFILIGYKTHGSWWSPLFFGASLLLLAVLIAYPRALKPLFIKWMAFAALLGWINTRILLTAFFYTILVPFGLLLKLAGKDSIQKEMKGEGESYWEPCEFVGLTDQGRYKKQF